MTPRRRPGPEGPGDPRLGRLLRWYPRAWRERYGEEFLALAEDTLDGRRPGWRLRLGVARAGLREHAAGSGGPGWRPGLPSPGNPCWRPRSSSPTFPGP